METAGAWEELFEIWQEKLIAGGASAVVECKNIVLRDTELSARDIPAESRPPLILLDAQNGSRYEILAGEKRFLAAARANKKSVTATVVTEETLSSLGETLLAELLKESRDPYTEALIFSRLTREYLLTEEDLAASTGRTKTAVRTSLRLIELPAEVTEMLRSGALGTGHCRAMLNLHDKNVILPLAEKIVSRHLSVRETERAVKSANAQFAEDAPADFGAVPEEFSAVAEPYKTLEHAACAKLGRRLKIEAGKRRNILTLEFYDEKDLRDLLERLYGGKLE